MNSNSLSSITKFGAPEIEVPVCIWRFSDASINLSVISLVSEVPSDSSDHVYIVQYVTLSTSSVTVPSGSRGELDYLQEYLRVKVNPYYRMIEEQNFCEDNKHKGSESSGSMSTFICKRYLDSEEIMDMSGNVGFIVRLSDRQRITNQLMTPLYPSAIQSITLCPTNNGSSHKMSSLCQQQMKRGLIGRILLYGLRNDERSFIIHLNALGYDFTSHSTRSYSFLVTALMPSQKGLYGIILPSTNISFVPSVNSEVLAELEESHVSKEAQTLINTIQSILSLSKDEKNITNISTDVSRAFILTGPPGGGKTFAIRTAVQSLKHVTRLISVRGSEILASSESSKALIRVVHSALSYCHKCQNKVVIIFMDECDALLSSDHFAHILGAILDQMSSVVRYDFFDNENSFAQAWRRIVVVAATNQVGSIPSQLRRPGRFDHEITVNPPDSNARLKILRSLLLPHRTCINAERGFRQSCKDNSEGPDNDEQVLSSMLDHLQAYDDTVGLQRIAEACVGYVPADLVSLVRKAVLIAVESRSEILKISHIDKAMRYVGASVLRASSVSSISKTSWDDIVGDPGGAKTELIRAVEWPRLKKEVFASLGLVPPRGILLYGPPGCAKTSLARAAAGATGVAFFSLSPADVYSSSYVGDAEAVIRRTFLLARSASPCILFFDEIDAIIGCSSACIGGGDKLQGLRRERSDGGSDAEIRVLSTFLNEMDGVDGSVEDGILIFAATNRPHTLDAALLRPGRFDKVIYVPPPDQVGRKMILESQCKWFNQDSLDLDYLASDRVSANMTGAELVGACREAAMMAIRDSLSVENEVFEPTIQHHHLESAIRGVKPLLADPQVALQFEKLQ